MRRDFPLAGGVRIAQSMALATALVALLAAPVYALSQITNSLTISPTHFGDLWNVDVKAKTVYDNTLIPPTVYPSNFIVAINYNHLRSPSIYYRQGPSGNFVYQSSLGVLSNQPGYYFQNTNALWVSTQQTWELNTTFKSHQATECVSTSRTHYHGQSDKWYNSSGPDIWVTTYTNTVC